MSSSLVRAAQAAAPGFFVLLWSTGFIGAKLGLPHAGPMSFLAIRFALATVLLSILAAALGAMRPSLTLAVHACIVGLLLQFLYLGGVFVGISRGVSPGLAALIVGFQPILTAAVAPALLGERLRTPQWAGLALGLLGVALVAWAKIDVDERAIFGMLAVITALLAITAGSVYQRRYCAGLDLASSAVLQNAVAAVAMTAAASVFEPGWAIDWTGEFVFALFWLVVVLSMGANLLMLVLIRRGGSMSSFASVFYLVPPTTAFIAHLLFDESLGPLVLTGFAATAAGVALVNRSAGRP